jgi:hypothetical protein
MAKLRLSHVMKTLPRYNNKFKSGPYKNGNYSRVTIVSEENGRGRHYDANDFPRDFLEEPWYVSKIYPVVTSAHCSNATVGLYIVLDKEEKQYV